MLTLDYAVIGTMATLVVLGVTGGVAYGRMDVRVTRSAVDIAAIAFSQAKILDQFVATLLAMGKLTSEFEALKGRYYPGDYVGQLQSLQTMLGRLLTDVAASHREIQAIKDQPKE